MQTSYNINHDAAFAGMKADSGFDRIISSVAVENIPFGRGLVRNAAKDGVALAHANKSTTVFDADFQSSNVISGSVNGVDFDDVSWDTDHDTTVAALVTEIDGMEGVSCVLDSTDTDSRTLLIYNDDNSAISVSISVTGGSGQPGVSHTYSFDGVFRGISIATHAKESDSSGVVQYLTNEPVNVITRGVVWVETSKAVDKDSDVYIDVSEDNGKFTDESSDNVSTGCKFRSSVGEAGLAKVEINLP
jgi:hypothetical protein